MPQLQHGNRDRGSALSKVHVNLLTVVRELLINLGCRVATNPVSASDEDDSESARFAIPGYEPSRAPIVRTPALSFQSVGITAC